jgi:transcriptional regulator with XRE-family HTH domain
MSTKEYRQELRARLGVLRHNTGGTYRAAAEASGISAQTISAWSRGQRVPRTSSMEKLRGVS